MAVQLLVDRNIPAPANVVAAVRMHAQDGPELAVCIVRVLFVELATTGADERQKKPGHVGYRLGYCADVFHAMPGALRRSTVFGEESLPTFFCLIDDADACRQK